jgi:hypothetical protein
LVLFYDDRTETTQPTLKVIQNGTGDIFQLFDGGAQVVTVKDGGNVGIGTTSPGTELDVDGDITADGIYLGGTVAANYLDDYEEGTYTVTLSPRTSGSFTLTTDNTLQYVKIGNICNVSGAIGVSSGSSPSGTYIYINLPFTVASLVDQAMRSSGSVAANNGSGWTGSIAGGVQSTGAEYVIEINAADVNTPSDWRFDVTYRVA